MPQVSNPDATLRAVRILAVLREEGFLVREIAQASGVSERTMTAFSSGIEPTPRTCRAVENAAIELLGRLSGAARTRLERRLSMASEQSERMGISQVRFVKLYEQQGGKCAICGTDSPPKGQFHVDHDHVSGFIRGLLCMNCNTAIGHFKDNPQLLRAAADYLERKEGHTTATYTRGH